MMAFPSNSRPDLRVGAERGIQTAFASAVNCRRRKNAQDGGRESGARVSPRLAPHKTGNSTDCAHFTAAVGCRGRRICAKAVVMRFAVLMILFALGAAQAANVYADGTVAPGSAYQNPAEAPTETQDAGPVHPWTMPSIEVHGQRKPLLREEERIGAYKQPRWTANRVFPTTRTYVVPAGTLSFEYWNRFNTPTAGMDYRRVRAYYEVEIGLGHRMQLDIYLITQQQDYKGPSTIKKESIELRYALADWGQLPGNPTVYLEWSRQNGGPDALEGKLLLAGQIAPGWHAGGNLVVERALGDEFGHEYQISGGLSHTLIDEKLGFGLEGRIEFHDKKGSRFKEFYDTAFLFGPSLNWHPVNNMRLLWVVLAGPAKGELQPASVTAYAGAVESWLVLGWMF